MTKRLTLIRHAKSSWSNPFADDHARVLNKRGRASATAIGGWLAEKGYLPDMILCSDAQRTRETADLLIPEIDHAPKLRLSSRLYHASPETILEVIHREPSENVAVIGHNPGIGMLAHALVTTPPDHHRFSDYPTCATTVIDFADDIARRKGTCVDFIVPRDLIGTTGSDID
ncbi:histidine phosphatase family protein [Cognatiyoonia sp. IB215446]|uniref:SixA phosphatase family protein n=1 Tax=Cognatiyoonia sp. IB215446 TaxID=3097355 RepID=UPI002A103A49|nr:histidine phosphatase family protein [Cognatiyoonia sp. IB215446]MDX8350121.1 histidine phosphatase family protein [Cognatiyoonia sp. IB215446]